MSLTLSLTLFCGRCSFTPYGDVEYCVVTTDPSTGRSRGTAFVKYAAAHAAAACLAAAAEGATPAPTVGAAGASGRPAFQSVLHEDAKEGLGLWLDGRRLLVSVAVDRRQAATLTTKGEERRDKRNLYLAREGSTYRTDSDSHRETHSVYVCVCPVPQASR
jgi:nucleolar protein 4